MGVEAKIPIPVLALLLVWVVSCTPAKPVPTMTILLTATSPRPLPTLRPTQTHTPAPTATAALTQTPTASPAPTPQLSLQFTYIVEHGKGINDVFAISVSCLDNASPCLGKLELLFEYPTKFVPFVPISWSPNGRQLVIEGLGVGDKFDIFVLDQDGRNKVNITNKVATNDRSPAWSPDGSWIAYSVCSQAGCQIYSSEPDGSNRTQLLTLASVHSPDESHWSPDGKQLVFEGYDESLYPSHIYTSNLDGSNLTQITHNTEYESRSPAFSRDGSWIVFTRDIPVEFGGLNQNIFLIRMARMKHGLSKMSRKIYLYLPGRLSGIGSLSAPIGILIQNNVDRSISI